jgi:alpha-beta hydrolase superfamily lysophospholipase
VGSVGSVGRNGTIVVALVLGILAGACVPASWGADRLLYPKRRPAVASPVASFEAVEFEGDGVKLAGRWFHTRDKRGTVVFLHGMSDNRASGGDITDHFVARGFEVITYDSRAHGESEGNACTYGYYEKRDLERVLDRVETRPIVVMGFSMGAAVALQAAAVDRRINAVVAVSPFSDLRTIAEERAPFFATRHDIDTVFKLAEQRANFRADEVSPLAAAAHITVPALIIHGARDRKTQPDHSQRIFAALRAPKELILVPNRGHRRPLTEDVWREIDAWLDAGLSPLAAR